MRQSAERKRQIEHEIQWLKDKLKTIPQKKQKYRRDIQRQIDEREYDLLFGNFD